MPDLRQSFVRLFAEVDLCMFNRAMPAPADACDGHVTFTVSDGPINKAYFNLSWGVQRQVRHLFDKAKLVELIHSRLQAHQNIVSIAPVVLLDVFLSDKALEPVSSVDYTWYPLPGATPQMLVSPMPQILCNGGGVEPGEATTAIITPQLQVADHVEHKD